MCNTITGKRAIVIGGSMSGLLAARVLSDYFEHVIILEREAFPTRPATREGVPQARHLHVLLPRGHAALEEFFPGLTNEWLREGADLLDAGQDLAWRTPAGWGIRFESDLRILAGSRPLMDFGVHQRVTALPNVTVRERVVVDGLLMGPDGQTVTGVRIRNADQGDHSELTAELVVDASGRMSRLPEWLESAGYEAPAETVINAHLGYASRVYRRNANDGREWKAMFLQAAPPDNPRAAVVFPIEGNRWMVTMCGGGKDYPPTDESGFLEFARSLPSPQVSQLISSSEPLTPIVGYRRTENRRRHYERLRRFPGNLLVFGDAACAFNPVYGQGISVASACALALRQCLAEDGRSSLPARFHRRQAGVGATAWALATAEDVRYRNAEGAKESLGASILHWYVHQVMAAATYDSAVRYVLLRVFGMVDEPSAFFRPAIALKVLRQAVRARNSTVDSENVRRALASRA